MCDIELMIDGKYIMGYVKFYALVEAIKTNDIGNLKKRNKKTSVRVIKTNLRSCKQITIWVITYMFYKSFVSRIQLNRTVQSLFRMAHYQYVFKCFITNHNSNSHGYASFFFLQRLIQFLLANFSIGDILCIKTVYYFAIAVLIQK